MSKNRNIITLSMVFVLTAALGTAWAASSPPVMMFESSFENESREVGYEVVWNDPNIGQMFSMLAGATDQFMVVDTPAIGSLAMSAECRNGGGVLNAIQRPAAGLAGLFPGQIVVMEFDVYIPTGTSIYFVSYNGSGLNTDAQYCAGLYGSAGTTKWYCRNYDTNNVFSYVMGPSVEYNKWNHIRMEFYGSDRTYSVWITPQGGDQVQVFSKAGMYNCANYSIRPLFGAQQPDDSLAYYDNIKSYCIDEYAQGYPTIFATKNTITIDGQMNMATEWSDALKVASRPAGGIGNYRNYVVVNAPLNPTTWVDTYVTHDANNFYIATRMNNAKWGSVSDQDVWYYNSGLTAVFFVDVNGFADSGMGDITSVFRASAGGVSPLSDPNKFDILYAKYVGYVPGSGHTSGIPYGKTLPAGAQISYSVDTNTKIMEIEMKIPFSAMPELDYSRGAKVGLSFTVRDDTGRGTTTLVGEEVPYFSYYQPRDYKTVNPNVGVSFAACGDLVGDFVADCVIDYKDIAEFIAHWLDCTKPDCP